MANIDNAYNWAVMRCNAANVGYSQPYRNEKTVNGITYYDCSSFIWYALKAAGYDVERAYRTATGSNYSGNAITTANLCNFLLALGFTEESINGEWKKSDIVWRSGHCEMVYTGGNGQGVTMGAHSANRPLADQVSINTSPSSNFTRIFRHGSGGGGGTELPSVYVIAAICGNFWQESGIDPGIWENLDPQSWTTHNHGYGLGQWTNYNTDQGRLYNLHQYLSSNGYADDDGNGQLSFLLSENYWTPHADYSFQSLEEFLQSDSTDIAMLTHAYNQCWEGIHDSTWDTRVTYANNCYDYIMEHWNEPNTWITGNRYLSDDERYNNCICVYQFLNGLIPGSTGKKGMPIYMMMKRRRGFYIT